MDIKINKTPVGTLRYPHHSHRRYEIMHYTQGQGHMWTESGEIPFSGGTVIIIPPGCRHGSESEGEFVNISIEYDFDGLLAIESPTAIYGSESDDAAHLVRMIWKNRHGNEGYLHSLCTAYTQYLLERIDVGGKISLCVRKIIADISEEAFNPEIDLPAILHSSGYAEDYIRACFKREVGKTPVEFLTDIRMEHASYLIDIYKDTLSLSEISLRCGYFDYIYFSKKFKEYTGLSPRDYRNGR